MVLIMSFEVVGSKHSNRLERLKARDEVTEEMLREAQEVIDAEPLLQEDKITERLSENGFIAQGDVQLDPAEFLNFRLQTIKDDQEALHLIVDADNTTPDHIVPYPKDKAA